MNIQISYFRRYNEYHIFLKNNDAPFIEEFKEIYKNLDKQKKYLFVFKNKINADLFSEIWKDWEIYYSNGSDFIFMNEYAKTKMSKIKEQLVEQIKIYIYINIIDTNIRYNLLFVREDIKTQDIVQPLTLYNENKENQNILKIASSQIFDKTSLMCDIKNFIYIGSSIKKFNICSVKINKKISSYKINFNVSNLEFTCLNNYLKFNNPNVIIIKDFFYSKKTNNHL